MVWAPTASGLPPEFLRSCLLLLLAEHEGHGYELCDAVVELGVDVDSGTIYRHLRGMEDEHLVASHWELSESGPPRRTYALTAEGLALLRRCNSAIHATTTLMERYAARSDAALASLDGGG